MTENSSTDLISELAKKRRSKLVEAEVNSDDPEFMDRINYSLVKFWMRESALPLAQVDADQLVSALGTSGTYGAQLAPVMPGDLVTRHSSGDLYRMTPLELLSAVFKHETAKVATFEGGRFPIKNDFVPIQQIRIDRYSVGVLVGGTSRVAETIAEEVVELLWATAGSRRTFDDCRPDVMSTLYGTQTRVKAPVNLGDFLSPTVRAFIDENLVAGERFAARMRAINSQPLGQESFAAVVAPAAVNFTVYTMNLQTGLAEEAALNFQVPSRGDTGARLINVTSALQYEDHVRMVTVLFNEIKAADAAAQQ